jgi:hypothetical protein
VPGANVSVENATTAEFTLTPNLGNDLTCTVTNVAPDPTFAITKSLTGESGTVAGRAEAGEQLTYTITATNTSQADAVGAVIADPVPAHGHSCPRPTAAHWPATSCSGRPTCRRDSR